MVDNATPTFSESTQVNVSAIIVNWNTRDLLEQCLGSIYSYPPEDDFEVFVVDNASSDDSVRMIQKKFPQVHLLQNTTNVGFARANNQALRLTKGRYVLLLNSDAVLPRNGLAVLTSLLDAIPEAGAVGPLYLNSDGTFQASFADFPRLSSELIAAWGLSPRCLGVYHPSHSPDESQIARSVDWVPGACLLIRKEMVAQIGLLDEGFFFYSEEVDWCYRMKHLGWQVWFCPDVAVVHGLGQSARKASETSLWHLYRGKVRFFAKHYGPYQGSALKTGILLGLLLKTLGHLASSAMGGDTGNTWHVYWAVMRKLLSEPVYLNPSNDQA